MWRRLVTVNGLRILIAGLYELKWAVDEDGRFLAVSILLICVGLASIGRASEGGESTIAMNCLSKSGAVYETLSTPSWCPDLTIQSGVPGGWPYVEAIHDSSRTKP